MDVLRPTQNLLAIRFRPTMRLIATVRDFVFDLSGTVLADTLTKFRIAITAHELLENAVKYSIDGFTTLRVDVGMNGASPAMAVRISNTAGADHIAELRRRFGDMAQRTNPFAYYTDLMMETATRDHGSGLGLARIWAEIDMHVSCDIVGSEATIIAQTNVALRESA